MVRVSFYREGRALRGFEASGHAGFAAEGSDVVCAAVSAVLLTALHGIQAVVGAQPRTVRRDGRGYLRVVIPRTAGVQTSRDAALILGVAFAGLRRIAAEYPGTVRLDIKKRRKNQ